MRFLPLIAVVLSACAVLGRGGGGGGGGGGSPPSGFVRSTAEARTTRVVEVREGLSRTQAMRLLVDALGQRLVVDVVDPRAGFAMTAWQATVRDGVPDLRYRTRVSARFLGDDWRHLQLRDEANWARGDEWEVGYDAPQLDSVAADVRARLGRRP